MRLVLAVTMHNETEYVDMQLDNALKMGIYDDIVVLDDGSDDGTWDILNTYKQKFNNIHIFRTEKNSVLFNGENRWKTISDLIRNNNYAPDWVHIRAADVLCPVKYAKLMKDQIIAMHPSVGYVSMPYVCLWRSLEWYRVDGDWGNWAHSNSQTVIWRYNKNFKWHPKTCVAKFHSGCNLPTDLGFTPCVGDGLVKPIERPPMFGLIHYGTSSHKKMETKFRWNMEVALATYETQRNIGVPIPRDMPDINSWLHFNGYKMIYEFNLELAQSKPDWFDESPEHGPEPKPKSFYEVIKEFNSERAEEYKEIFEQHFEEQK